MKHKLEDRRREKRSNDDGSDVVFAVLFLLGLFVLGLNLTESVYI